MIAKLRGHEIVLFGDDWFYCDNGASVVDEWKERPCGYCGKNNTPEGHDGCLGKLPGVKNACCGHGEADDAYIQFEDGTDAIRGLEAVEYMHEWGKGTT